MKHGKGLALLLALCMMVSSTMVLAEDPKQMQESMLSENEPVETVAADANPELPDAEEELIEDSTLSISEENTTAAETTPAAAEPASTDAAPAYAAADVNPDPPSAEEEPSADLESSVAAEIAPAAEMLMSQQSETDAEQTCAHDGYKYTEYELVGKAYADITSTSHTITATKVCYEVCADCGRRWEISQEPFSQRADHSFFFEGPCVCGMTMSANIQIFIVPEIVKPAAMNSTLRWTRHRTA